MLILELLILVDNLYAMLILLSGRLIAHVRKVAVNRHDRRRCRMSNVIRRATFRARALG